MTLVLLATTPTEAVLDGFLPAAVDLDLPVVLLTDRPHEWAAVRADVRGCDIHDARAVMDVVTAGHAPAAVFSNSDHLQAPTALVADYLGLPGKDWRACLRTKDNGLMRRALTAAGLDSVWARDLAAGEALPPDLPLLAVVKPRSGVSSEDVYLATTAKEVGDRVSEVAARRSGASVLVEEYLDGPLHTLETLGDGQRLRVLGGFRTTLGAPPTFVEERLDWCPELPYECCACTWASPWWSTTPRGHPSGTPGCSTRAPTAPGCWSRHRSEWTSTGPYGCPTDRCGRSGSTAS